MDLDALLRNALREDIGDGDHTSRACVPDDKKGTFQLLTKEAGVLAGLRIAQRIFSLVDSELKLTLYKQDGDLVEKGDIAFRIHGKERSLLNAERLVLNFMQRMSGIATTTAAYVKRVEGTGTKIMDTRKTTPGLRALEKEAVRLGGGTNHRFGLFDMILIKDNHIDCAGSISQAIQSAHTYLDGQELSLPIEVETRNLQEVEEVLHNPPVDRIMLDNFDFGDIAQAVERIGGRIPTEASGGITLDTVADYAREGVDFISVGALTHSASNLDMSLKAE